jgi:DNA-3-methyladenine glycosylase
VISRLNKNYFIRDTHLVCQDLIGKFLIHEDETRLKVGRIVEVEAYQGFNDRASHAARKQTPRNLIMFGPGGYYYIYLIYGMHYCLNIVTEKEGFPSAVLIRAVEPIYDSSTNLTDLGLKEKRILGSGPGRLCRWLEVDKIFNTKSVENPSLFMANDYKDQAHQPKIEKSKRVGVQYAGESAHLDWRYLDATSDYISHP